MKRSIYTQDYFGYVYLWFDRKHKMFYVGSHHGKIEDSYISSSKWMNDAYNKRPSDFKIRIIALNTINDFRETQKIEQEYLNMIKEEELSISKNVIAGTNRYYNMKKNAFGGSQKGHKKVRIKPSWNKGLTPKQTSEIYRLRKEGLFCLLIDKRKTITANSRDTSGKILIKKTCLGCSSVFFGTKKQKYCSKKCADNSLRRPLINKICPGCGKIFTVQNQSRQKTYCSRSCAATVGGRKCAELGICKENGKRGAKNQSLTVTGRKITIKDGKRVWENRRVLLLGPSNPT